MDQKIIKRKIYCDKTKHNILKLNKCTRSNMQSTKGKKMIGLNT